MKTARRATRLALTAVWAAAPAAGSAINAINKKVPARWTLVYP